LNNKSIWKQECITLATNLLANLNEIEHITESIKRLYANISELLFGLPTQFGIMSAQFKALLDSTGQLWVNGSLHGKFIAIFFSSATQYGGQETTAFTNKIDETMKSLNTEMKAILKKLTKMKILER